MIIILGGYVMLYWSVNKGLISLKGAGLMTLISLTAYLLFPFLLKRIEIQSITLLLFLFVLSGMAMVLLIEEKRRPILKINFETNINMGKIKDIMDKMNMPESIERIKMRAKSIIDRMGERLNGLVFNARNNAEKQGKEYTARHTDKNIRNEEYMNIDNHLDDIEEDISYVDFKKKSSKYESLFSPRHSKETIVENNIGAQEQIDIQKLELEISENQHSTSTKEAETTLAAASEVEPDAAVEEKSSLTIEQCIDKAFLLKESGMIWEAIEYYIEALDKKPDDQLMLWIVVDICSLYKQQGKDDMAKEMMQSFIESFGDEMDAKTKEEILRNI
jgi:tetratricopeptide (TPR) repeat protein